MTVTCRMCYEPAVGEGLCAAHLDERKFDGYLAAIAAEQDQIGPAVLAREELHQRRGAFKELDIALIHLPPADAEGRVSVSELRAVLQRRLAHLASRYGEAYAKLRAAGLPLREGLPPGPSAELPGTLEGIYQHS